MSLALAALCSTLKHEVPDQTTTLARSYAEKQVELQALQHEHRQHQLTTEDNRVRIGFQINSLRDQVTEARDDADDAAEDIGIIQSRVRAAMNDLTIYRYTRDDKYLGRAMAELEASLEPLDVKVGDRVESIYAAVMGGWDTQRNHPLRHGYRSDAIWRFQARAGEHSDVGGVGCYMNMHMNRGTLY